MNNKILVPTDFSANSRAGIRFAIQLASQRKTTLIFYHAVSLLKPTRWSEAKYEAYRNQQLKSLKQALIAFVKGVYKRSGAPGTGLQYVVEGSFQPERSIVDFAAKIKAGAICMSTRGAGRFKKLIGTNASAILSSSPVPVFIIPQRYRRTPISNILYSSDLDDLNWELKQVMNFGNKIGANISVYHYDYLLHLEETKLKLLKTADRFKGPRVKFVFQNLNLEHSLAVHLLRDIRKSKASVAILFTNQKRGWFDKLFLSSKAAELSFNLKVPLLVYPKR
jgi:nucleotide-binding universal stress UspA family protein